MVELPVDWYGILPVLPPTKLIELFAVEEYVEVVAVSAKYACPMCILDVLIYTGAVVPELTNICPAIPGPTNPLVLLDI